VEVAKVSGSKSKKGPGGEYLCNNCSVQWNKKHACPVCGKMYRKSDASEDEENAWIRCDDCHRWVMTKCDNIEDLSIYDDSNPNHLHYSCPLCRGDIGLFSSNSHHPTKASSTSSYANPTSDPAESRLESVEKGLIDKIAEEYDSANQCLFEEELQEKLRTNEISFAEEISQYAASLIGKRDREWHKNQTDLDRQFKRLKEEKERLDEQIELDLVLDLKEFYKNQKKEFDKRRGHYYNKVI